MTSLICWAAVDRRGPTSVYIASDSRLSWSVPQNWDTGRKLFATKIQSDIFGYCGDVIFPSQKLSQIIDQLDNGFLFDKNMENCRKQEIIYESIKLSFGAMPQQQQRPFSILYCTRNGENMNAIFDVCKISWVSVQWSMVHLCLPEESNLIQVLGSGRKVVDKWLVRWQRSDIPRTSRAVFSAFCDALKNGEDSATGGAPQLVGIHRSGYSKIFGISYQGEGFFLGECITDMLHAKDIDWYNELMERCDGEKLTRLEGAQQHARPKQLKS